jgi:hypothetical protein
MNVQEIISIFLLGVWHYLVLLLCILGGWGTSTWQVLGEGLRALRLFPARRPTTPCKHPSEPPRLS